MMTVVKIEIDVIVRVTSPSVLANEGIVTCAAVLSLASSTLPLEPEVDILIIVV